MNRKRIPKFIPWTPTNIKALARHVGNQQELAKLLDVLDDTVSQWVNGWKKPNPTSKAGLNFIAQKYHFKVKE